MTKSRTDLVATGQGAYQPAVLERFEQRLQWVWKRDGFAPADRDRLARLLRIVIADLGFRPASDLLHLAGVRTWWNAVFARQRSAFIADWVLAHLKPPVLDVLGGDFTVLRALLTRGLNPEQVVGCERSYAYDLQWSEFDFPVHPVPEDLTLPDVAAYTLLISTVLHHEPEPERLLQAAAVLAAPRWVVIENCVDGDNDAQFHLFVDEFFNRCLNNFEVPCVAQHRTASQWQELLGRYGSVTHIETRQEVPGMPFPYTVFVVDR